MERDIENRGDLELLLREFYAVAMTDAQIGHFFTRIVQLDLETHIPVIANFWEKVLFGNPVYFGNPMALHQHLHEKSPITKEHFERWLRIWTETVNRLFAGETADKAKEKAVIIADSLLNRLQNPFTAINR